MSVNRKVDEFTLDDVKRCGKTAFLKQGSAKAIVEEVTDTVSQWPDFAAQTAIDSSWTKQIANHHRLLA